MANSTAGADGRRFESLAMWGGGVRQLTTIETPKGNVFTLSHNVWTKEYTAAGPLHGGRSLVRLSDTVRVSTAETDYDDAVYDLIEQLVRLGY